MVPVRATVPYARAELVARARAAGDVKERYAADGIRIAGHLPAAMAAEVRAARVPTRRSTA
jgi:hypothetical protein